MLWGALSYRGLIPSNGPIFVDDWLESEFVVQRGQKKTIDGHRYAHFSRHDVFAVSFEFISQR